MAVKNIPTESLLGCWYRAQESELGCVITIADPSDLKRTVNYLYNVRKEHGDKSLDQIMLCLPAGGKEIFLVQKAIELREEINARGK